MPKKWFAWGLGAAAALLSAQAVAADPPAAKPAWLGESSRVVRSPRLEHVGLVDAALSVPLESLGLVALITYTGFKDWKWGSASFRFNSEGWFGMRTGSGGLDKLGHVYAPYMASELLYWINGFADAGVLVSAPVRELICKLNIIENCGAGIVMGDDAEASAVSIENNHIRDIRGTGVLAAAGLAVGIGVARAAAATVAGNQIRRVALAAANARFMAGIFMLGVERSRIHGNQIGEIGPTGDFGGICAGILVTTPYAECDVARNQVERDAEPQAAAGEAAWAALLIAEGSFIGRTGGETAGTVTTGTTTANTGAAVNRTANTTTVRIDDRRTLIISGNRATISTARNDFIGSVAVGNIAGAAAAAVQGGAASVQGNTFTARGRAPAVYIVASAEALFSDNRCTHQSSRGLPAVQLATPVALVNANRVRSGDLSIVVTGSKTFTALGNITSGVVRVNNNPLPAPWAALNVIA